MKALLLLLTFFKLISAKIRLEKDSSEIYILNSENIDYAVKTLDSLLVVFYSPKCQSCLELQALLPKVGKYFLKDKMLLSIF